MALRLSRDMALTLVLQGSGGLATLLAALWVGRALGPAQQGQFNQLKSLIDLGAALSALGLPQALYVYVQSGRLGLGQARAVTWWVALLGLPVGWIVMAFSTGGGLSAPAAASGVAVAVACATLHAQWRPLALLGYTARRFNVITAFPQLLLLLLAAALVASGGASAAAIAWGYAAIWLLGAACAGLLLTSRPPSLHRPDQLHRAAGQGGAQRQNPRAPFVLRQVSGHGLATWATGLLVALQIVLLQRAGSLLGAAEGLSLISLGLLLAQIPLTPLNYALPLLLRDRLRADTGQMPLLRPALAAALPMLALGVAAGLLPGTRSDLWMGAGYQGLQAVTAALLLTSGADAVLRILGVAAQAARQPWRSTCAELLRTAALGAFLASGLVQELRWSVSELALGWCALSWCAAALLWLLCRTPARAAAPA